MTDPERMAEEDRTRTQLRAMLRARLGPAGIEAFSPGAPGTAGAFNRIAREVSETHGLDPRAFLIGLSIGARLGQALEAKREGGRWSAPARIIRAIVTAYPSAEAEIRREDDMDDLRAAVAAGARFLERHGL